MENQQVTSWHERLCDFETSALNMQLNCGMHPTIAACSRGQATSQEWQHMALTVQVIKYCCTRIGIGYKVNRMTEGISFMAESYASGAGRDLSTNTSSPTDGKTRQWISQFGIVYLIRWWIGDIKRDKYVQPSACMYILAKMSEL